MMSKTVGKGQVVFCGTTHRRGAVLPKVGSRARAQRLLAEGRQ